MRLQSSYLTQNEIKDRKDGSKFTDYEFSKTGQSLKWMRVSIHLEPIACGTEYGQELDPTKDHNAVKVMALTPEETDELINESKPAQFARVGDELVNKLIPFASDEADSPIAAKLTAASGAVSILFKNLFPPRAVAYSYGFIDSDISSAKDENGKDTFGWYWRQKNVEKSPESIVGLRRAVAFLQVKRGVKAIKVSYRIDAKWSGDYSTNVDDEYVDEDELPYKDLGRVETTINFDKSYCLPPPPPQNFFEQAQYDFLPHINDFPMLIPKEIACQIFHKNINPFYLRAEDVIKPRLLLKEIADSQKPILYFLWDKRRNQIMEKVKFDRNSFSLANWNAHVNKLRPDYQLKKMLADEINIILRDAKSEFFQNVQNLISNRQITNPAPTLWHSATVKGSNTDLLLFYRKLLFENYKDASAANDEEKIVVNDYDEMDECTEWFRKEFDGRDRITSNGQEYTMRELVKEKLNLPTLKQETEALTNVLRPKPSPTP